MCSKKSVMCKDDAHFFWLRSTVLDPFFHGNTVHFLTDHPILWPAIFLQWVHLPPKKKASAVCSGKFVWFSCLWFLTISQRWGKFSRCLNPLLQRNMQDSTMQTLRRPRFKVARFLCHLWDLSFCCPNGFGDQDCFAAHVEAIWHSRDLASVVEGEWEEGFGCQPCCKKQPNACTWTNNLSLLSYY